MFKQGYLVEVTTWENDGDHYRTTQYGGQTKPQVTFLLALLGHFGSGTNPPNNAPLFGNSGLYPQPSTFERSYRQFIDAMDELRNQYVDEFDHFFKQNNDKDKSWQDIKANLFVGRSSLERELCHYYYCTLVRNLLGSTIDYEHEDCFFRVVEEIKVSYIPEDIEYLSLDTFGA